MLFALPAIIQQVFALSRSGTWLPNDCHRTVDHADVQVQSPRAAVPPIYGLHLFFRSTLVSPLTYKAKCGPGIPPV